MQEARTIENIPLELFSLWKTPLMVSVFLWVLLYFLTVSRSHLCRDNTLGWSVHYSTVQVHRTGYAGTRRGWRLCSHTTSTRPVIIMR